MRKETKITIENGRDAGKSFKIIEMPAYQMDKWATRALLAFGKSGIGVQSLFNMTSNDLFGSFLQLDYTYAEPLLNELLECCYYITEPKEIKLEKGIVNSIVEDYQTLFKLRIEAFKLNVGFKGVGDG